ncbi:MAG: AsmA family protein, partial [Nitrospinae bacterium]|nr:AsmA family protein [Nitrospinota bacterium]
GIFFLFLGAFAAILPSLIDLNNYKKQIAEAVKKQTGRDIVIDGDIKLTVFPWVGANIGKVSLSNASGFGNESFLALESASVAVKLMPLIEKKVEVKTVTVNGLNVNLQKNAQGVGNWEDLIVKEEKKETPAKDSPAKDTPAQAAVLPLASLTIEGVTVENSNVRWKDASTGIEASLQNITVKTGAIVSGEPLESMLSFDLESSNPKLKGNVKLSTNVHFDKNYKPVKLTGTNLQSDMTFQDNSTGMVASVKKINLAIESLVEGEPVEVALSFLLENNKPELDGNVSLKTKVFLKEDFSLAKLTGTNIESNMTMKDSKTGLVASVKDLVLKTGTLVPGKSADLNLSFSVAKNAPEISGSVNLQTNVDVNDDFSIIKVTGTQLKTNLAGAGIPSGGVALTFQANAAFNKAKQSLSLNNLMLVANDLKVSGEVMGTGVLDKPAFSGKVTVDAFNPKAFMKAFSIPAPQTADPNAMTHLGVITSFDVSQTNVALNNLWAKIDQTTVRGNASVKNFSKPSINYDFQVDTIDVDRYLPPVSKTQEASQTSGGASSSSDKGKKDSPLGALFGLNIHGMLKVGSAKVQNITLTNIVSGVQAKDAIVNLNPIKASFFKGNYDGSIRINGQKGTPFTAVSTSIKGINIGQVLKTFAETDVLNGTANINSDLTFTGLEVDEIKKSLGGKGDFIFLNGSIKGFNIAAMIRKAREAVTLPGKSVSDTFKNITKGDVGSILGVAKGVKDMDFKSGDAAEPMDFTELSGSVNINKGFVVNRDLKMKSPLLRVTGEGSTSLTTEKIDYLINATVVGSLEGQGGKDDLTGLTVPIQITGTHKNINRNVDLLAIGKFLLKKLGGQNTTNGNTQEPIEKTIIKKVAPPKVQQLLEKIPLKGLFN